MAMKTQFLKIWVVWIFPFTLMIFGGARLFAGTLPADVLSELNNDNVTWTTPSTNGSPGSMPIGNGDITANVWVENNGGDLMFYVGKSDSWSEGTRLLKVGRVRTHFSPNPFASGSPFSQTLNFYNGEIDITAGPAGSQVYLRLWIDANHPVLRLAARQEVAEARLRQPSPTTTFRSFTKPASMKWMRRASRSLPRGRKRKAVARGSGNRM